MSDWSFAMGRIELPDRVIAATKSAYTIRPYAKTLFRSIHIAMLFVNNLGTDHLIYPSRPGQHWGGAFGPGRAVPTLPLPSG